MALPLPFQNKILSPVLQTTKDNAITYNFGDGYSQVVSTSLIPISIIASLTLAPLSTIDAGTLQTFLYDRGHSEMFEVTLPSDTAPSLVRMEIGTFTRTQLGDDTWSIKFSVKGYNP